MTKKILVTLEGHQKLVAIRQQLYGQLATVQSQKAEAAEVGGNVWHDNFAFEELVRQENSISSNIAQATQRLANAQIVGKPRGDEVLQIGHVAVLVLDGEERREYQIVGFGESVLDTTPQRLEYLAPIIRPFFAKEVGTVAEVTIAGQKRETELVEIKQREPSDVSGA